MNPNLSHLPSSKQNELTEIVKIISEIANAAKIILFGSHTSYKFGKTHFSKVIS